MLKQSKPQQSNVGKKEPANRRETGTETPSQNSQPKKPESNAKEVHPVVAFIKNMKADNLGRDEMIQGLVEEFDVPMDIAQAWVNKEMSAEKKSVLEIFKNKPSEKASYTDPDYEVQPGESDGVHIQAEVRTFDRDGNILSKPQILKFGDREWTRWLANRQVTGYSINKILHRPANIAPFEVDEWRGPKPEGR